MNIDLYTRTESENSLIPILVVLAKRKLFLIGVPILSALIALVYCLLTDPIYTAETRLLPPQYNENTFISLQNKLGGESQIGNSSLTLKNPTDLFVGILSSRTIIDSLIDNLDLYNYYNIDNKYRLRKKLIGATKFRVGKDGIITILVEDTNSIKAAEIANSFVKEFYEFSRNLAVQRTEIRSNFYENALSNAQKKLEEAELALLEVEQTTGFTRLVGQDQAIIQAAAELQAQISTKNIQLRTMRTYATRTNPDVVVLTNELANLKNELKNLVNANEKILKDLEKSPDESNKPSGFISLSDAPSALLKHNRKTRDVYYWESIVILLGKYYEFGKIDERRDMSLFQVLDEAIPPQDKSKPRTKINVLLALISSGFFSIIWILITEYISKRRRDSDYFNEQWKLLFNNFFPAFIATRLVKDK